MDRRSLKCIAALFLAAGLIVVHMMTAFAANVLSPEAYVFSMVLRACGVTVVGEVAQWQEAYTGYLESTGDQAMLQKFKGYSGLPWGADASGTDDLYWSVRSWLSQGIIHEDMDSNGNYFCSMPSSPGSLPSSSFGVCGVEGTPFSDVNIPSDTSGYVYAFSEAYNGSTMYVRRNVYAPAGLEIFGITTSFLGYSPSGIVFMRFYTPDASAVSGYRQVSLYSIATGYRLDTGVRCAFETSLSAVSSFSGVGCRSVMNLPFKVFATAHEAEAYCKTGIYDGHVFSDRSMALWFRGAASGSDRDLLNKEVKSVGSSIKLPADAAAAASCLASLKKPLEPGRLTSALSDAGMEISYVGTYTVEHYKQDVSDMDAPVSWLKESEELLTGIIGQPPSITPKSYPNFLYAPELTDPQDGKILADDSLVIRLYYKPDPDATLPYTVEYHKDGEIFETISGTVPMFGDRIVRTCEDLCPQYYLPDNKASTPLPFEVSEQKDTIHIYYKRDLYAKFSYTVEYYKDGELFKAVPGSVSVFDPLVRSCLSYCPSGYVLNTSSSTSLPYSVSNEGGVIKNYYVKKDTVVPYTVEYYKDGLRTNVISGNVPSASPVLQSYPSQCPEYYKLDAQRSTPMPFTVPEGGGRVRVYYKKDEAAVFPYTVECYKDGELVESVSKTVSVFNPSVKEYGFDCPEGYVVDTSSSTSLPYSVSKEGSVIKYYYVDEGKTLPYTVEYYKDGTTAMVLSGNVPVTSPVVKQYWPYSPNGYILDKENSDALPFTVTKENNIIHAYYVPDPSNPYASFVGGVKTLINSIAGFFKRSVWWLILLAMLCMFLDKNLVLFKRITSHMWAGEADRKKRPSKKSLIAPKSRFMKGVHANKGSSLRSKANMQKGVRPGSLKSKATISDRRWRGGYTRR